MGSIFISYARADAGSFARKLYHDLTARQIAAWMDVENIPAGADYEAAIDDALKDASAVLVVLTPGAVSSLQVKSEYQAALSRHIPIMPLLAVDCTPPRVLRPFQYLDFRTDYMASFDNLACHLQSRGTKRNDLQTFEMTPGKAPAPDRGQSPIKNLRQPVAAWGQSVTHERGWIAFLRAPVQVVLGTLALLIAARLIPGIVFMGDGWQLLLTGSALGLMNLPIKPLLIFFSLPLVWLGLFYLVINMMMLLLASALIPNLEVHGCLPAILGSLPFAALNWLVQALEKRE